MTRVGFVLKVKQSMIDEYVRRHREVWPEMLAALSEAGWRNYSLFLRPDGTLFGYLETPGTFQDALAAMDGREVNDRWQAEMAPFFEIPEGAAPDASMVELTEVFHLD